MNKETKNTNIFGSVATAMPVLTSETNKAAAYRIWIIGAAFVVHREFLSKSSDSDYIENKTKLEGCIKIQSITQNSFIKSFNQFMQCSLGNIRPHVIFNKAANLNKTLILEL